MTRRERREAERLAALQPKPPNPVLEEMLRAIEELRPKPEAPYLIVCNPRVKDKIASSPVQPSPGTEPGKLFGIPVELDEWAPLEHIIIVPYSQKARYEELRQRLRPIKAAYLAANPAYLAANPAPLSMFIPPNDTGKPNPAAIRATAEALARRLVENPQPVSLKRRNP